ncbi:MAG TPA: hypothetical protein VGB75_19210 [Jatrophihabitans sp.]|uniref:hypothetical protein n=1 Tax=Jatrophihabitans sp. TaxID=1932789 RepID=UPI002EFAF9BF
MTGAEGEPARARRVNPLAVVAVLVAAMAFYFALIGYRGLYLLGEDRWVLKALGAAVLVLPVVGGWVVVAELRFGLASQRLERRMREAGESTALPALPRLPSGRLDRAAADGWFDQQRSVVERAPQDWRAWFRLAQAYDLAGDRKRAREALRTAIDKAGQGS